MMDDETRALLGRYADDPRIITGDAENQFVIRVDDSGAEYYLQPDPVRRSFYGEPLWVVLSSDDRYVATADLAEHALGMAIGDPQDEAGQALFDEDYEGYGNPELGPAYRLDPRIRRDEQAPNLFWIGERADHERTSEWTLHETDGYWFLRTVAGEDLAVGEDPEAVLREQFGRPYHEVRLITQLGYLNWITAMTREGVAVQALVAEGLIAIEHRGRPVYVLTDAGRAEAERLAA